VRFIDIFRATASDDGEYSAYGPDLSGTVRLLRFKDGVHFTQSGYAKLAHFIERQLNRDLGEARSERDTPLAGNDAEQQRVLALAVPVGKDASKMQAAGEGRGQETGGHRGGQPADSARLTLSVKGANGRVQRTTVDLLRPAIAGSVIAVLTRGQSDDRPSKVGLTISDELPNGLLVLRSITPSLAVREGANRLPASQLPFFRVLVKGERPTPVEGRADDFRWPRDDRTLPSDVRMAARPANVVTPRAQPMPQWDPSIPPLPRRKPLRLSPDAPFSPRLE
jgi:hypothetical protein